MNDSSESPKIGHQGKVGELSLRAQRTQDLRNISEDISNLLSHPEVLADELRIKLDTLHADIAAILEDRDEVPEETGDDSANGSTQETS